jgi:hypothetical protein
MPRLSQARLYPKRTRGTQQTFNKGGTMDSLQAMMNVIDAQLYVLNVEQYFYLIRNMTTGES